MVQNTLGQLVILMENSDTFNIELNAKDNYGWIAFYVAETKVFVISLGLICCAIRFMGSNPSLDLH